MSLTRAPISTPQQSHEQPAFHPGLMSPLYVDRASQGGLVGLQGSLGNDFLKLLAGLGSSTLPALESDVGAVADGAASLFGCVPLVGELALAAAQDTKQRTQAGVGFARGGLDLVSGLVGVASDPGAALAGVGEMLEHTPGMMACLRGLDGMAAWADGEGTLGQAALAPFDHGRDWDELKGFWGGLGSNLVAPYKESLASGRPFEAFGRASFEVVSNLVGGGTAGVAGVKGLGWADELADGARVGKTSADLSRAAGAGSWVGNKITDSHIDELVSRIRATMGAEPKLAGFDADTFRRNVQLRDAATHEAFVVRSLLAQNKGMTQAEAAAMASRFPSYENAGRVYMSDQIDPARALEALQHEAIHTVAGDAWRVPGARAANEGVTQWLTERLLGEKGIAYGEHVDVVETMASRVGGDSILDQLVAGSPEGLAAMLDQILDGEGGRVMQLLDDAQARMMNAQRLDGTPTPEALSASVAAQTGVRPGGVL